MRRLRYIVLSAAIVLGALAFGPAHAVQPLASISAFSTSNFDETGTIDRIDLKHGEIVVDDDYFVLSSRLRVYSSNGVPVSAKALKKGMTIGYIVAQDGSGQQLISDILILSVN